MPLATLRPLAILACLGLLAGCSSQSPMLHSADSALTVSGTIHGGQQPITGATIQLYTVGTAGDGSTATALLSPAVTSDSSGSFSLSNLYHCNPASEQVYLVGTGGNPGLGGTANNPNIAMMAALGPCNLLTTSTYIDMNEVTTLGSLAALYPYMTGPAALGSGTADLTAFTNAFTQVLEFVNIGSGLAPGPTLPSGFYASTTELNTLADILAPCINSAGGASGDGTACGNLFLYATPPGGTAPTDTLTAAIDILNHPTNNASQLFATLGSSPPFQPTLTAAPTTWALTIKPVPAAPTLSIQGGSYAVGTTLTLSSTTSGATIYYTTGGSTPTASSTAYSAAITLAGTETVNAIAVLNGVSSSVTTATYAIGPAAAAPVLTSFAASGSDSYDKYLVMTSTTANATIHYTLDGSAPTAASSSVTSGSGIYLYGSTQVASTTYNVSAIATAPGYSNSPVTAQTYSISYPQDSPPSFSPAPGTYTTAQTVVVSTSYGTLGLISCSVIPYVAGTFGTSLTYNVTQTTSFSCTVSGGTGNNRTSNAATALYTINPNYVAPPAASPLPGTYASGQFVTLTSATSGAKIYYTTDGSTPSASSTLYTQPVAVSASDTINAIAFASGYSSTTAALAYTLTITHGRITTVAGNGVAGSAGVEINDPYGLAADSSGYVYVADNGNQRVIKFLPYDGATNIGDGDTVVLSGLTLPQSVAADSAGDVFSDHTNYIAKTTPAGTTTNFATISAQGMAFDSSGNLYVAAGSTVKKVTAAGVVTTVVGNGTSGYNGDNIAALSAELRSCTGVALDAAGNLYIADQGNNRIRKVTTGGIISTVAGTGTAGYNGDGIAATSAQLNFPFGVAVDSAGSLYITDTSNYRIRKVSSGTISTVAGTGSYGYSGDGGLATSAQIDTPLGIVIDLSGNLFFSDSQNSRVRRITP